MCIGEGGDQGINTCVWGRGTMEFIHVYGGGGNRELICVCVCMGGGETRIQGSNTCVCGGRTKYYVWDKELIHVCEGSRI